MKSDHDILKKDDLIELTGHHFSKKQSQWLAEAGIWFKLRKDGTPSTTWFHVANPIQLRPGFTEAANTEPNYDAM